MTRLFIRFYLGVLFILFTAWFVQLTVVRQRSDERNEGVVERALGGGLRMVREQLDQTLPGEMDAALQAIGQEFEYPVQILDIESGAFSNDERTRLQRFDEIVFYSHDGANVATPLSNKQQVVSLGPLPSFVGPSQTDVVVGLGVILSLAALAIAVLLRPVARQLREVERTATAIAEGNLSARIDPQRVPKGKHLASAFNSMADRMEALLRTQRELLQAVSHEFRTPLARIRFAIDLIGTAKTDEERRLRLETVDAATEELDQLVEELLSYVRMETTESPLELQSNALPEAVETLLERQATLFPDIEFDVDQLKQNNIVVRADTSGLQRVLGNLIDNACRFANHRVRIQATREEGCIAIDIEDDGGGIPESDRPHVLQPFVRLDNQNELSDHRGVGLGLALVNRIVTSHDGRIEIDKSDLGGCRIRTTWPH
ncbi:Sensor protein RstB [Symmachiella macrocystis]|uniref:histidine kinase n=1 Tax=Symmachiella macrocystis TaxID=2527985 RepID=A0A5C6B7P1_9PLAN|nr:ATP-binding protein [Symmachiella macrocystis]TWU07316.1 Sensor protein RstB [Symmachiella macrocystis]